MAHVTFGVVAVLLGSGMAACGAGKGAPVALHPGGRVPLAVDYQYGDYDNDDYEPGRSSNADADGDDLNGRHDRDGDLDNQIGTYYDGDDEAVRTFGSTASSADRRAIASLLKRYYTAAAAGDGAQACSLIATARAAMIAQEFDRPSEPPYLRGNSCAAVMSKLFKTFHRQLAIYPSELEVVRVGIIRARALALVVLSLKSLSLRRIMLRRERGTWMVEGLLDAELP